MIALDIKQEIIIRNIFKGESQRSISKDTGIHRNTIKKYIDEYSQYKFKLTEEIPSKNIPLIIDKIVEKPKYNLSTRKKRKLSDEIISKVEEYLQKNEEKKKLGQHKQLMNKIIIHEELIKENYDISYSTICTLVNKLSNKSKEAFIKQEYEFGEICEFDWGEVKILIEGTLQIFQMAVFTLAKENYRYALLFNKQNTQSFQEAHALFFDHIGGVPKKMVYDNMKVAVKKFVGKTEKEPTEGLLKLSLYYGFDFRFCNIASGNEKGHVEKSVGYIRSKAFSVRDEFKDLNKANIYLHKKCDELNLKPRKEEGNKSSKELLEIARKKLLPKVTMFECSEKKDLRVDKYSTIIVDTCHYSVEDRLVNKIINVRIYPEKIICSYEGEVVGEHDKNHSLNKWIIKIEHYLKTLTRKPGALSGSTALSQADKTIKDIHSKYFILKPKEFVELLIYISEKDIKLSKIEDSIKKLIKLGVKEITTELIKNISGQKELELYTTERIENEIEKKSLEQLSSIAQFFETISSRQKEVILS